MDNQNNVWIDREEYERLKSLEDQHTASQLSTPSAVTNGPVFSQSTDNIEAPAKSSVSVLTIITGIFAILSFLYPPAIIIFLGLGIASLVRFFRGRASHSTKVGVGLAVGIGATLLIIVAGPFLLLLAFVIFWQIGCWTGLGSCTTA